MTANKRGLLVKVLALTSTKVVCRSYVIQSGTWKYKGVHPIAFEQARIVHENEQLTEEVDLTTTTSPARGGGNTQKEPLLLLNGFAVGSFHQHRLIHHLFCLEENADRTIYCMDYLGQGKSWPEDCQDGQGKNEEGLRYCGETWVNQIVDFLNQIVLPQHQHQGQKKQRVHIAGNSVGGHLAVFVAAKTDLVESLCLLNATPVWGFNLPGWSGHLPAPLIPKLVGRYLFDRIRDVTTIEQYLTNAYANVNAFDGTLIQQIRDCTEGHQGGHAAFTSIMWSPPISVPLAVSVSGNAYSNMESKMGNFHDCLRALQCDVLLLYGRDDPWCKPAFAKRMLRDLRQRKRPTTIQALAAPTLGGGAGIPASAVERYIELSSVGHCPNHEAPTAVARVLSSWMDPPAPPLGGRSKEALPLVASGGEVVQELWGQTTMREREENEIRLSLLDRLAIALL